MSSSFPSGSYAEGFPLSNLPLTIRKAVEEACGLHNPTVTEKVASTFMRLNEIVLATIALVVTSPIMLLVAAIIRFDSPGPVLFWQKRIGQNGRLFWFCKFRTLKANARSLYPELYRYRYTPEEIERLQFKNDSDPRVTPAGRWLRRSTLDELPNFWNLLKGDIALVGPRPEIPEMLPYYPPEQLIKFSVKPGITGIAQTSGRGRLKFRQTNAFDVQYVRNKSFFLDCKIILKTIKLVIRLDGAF